MKENKIYRNKIIGTGLLIIAIFALLVIFHRMGYYRYEYHERFAPYDYGKYNFFSYFTVQSNIMTLIYLFFVSLSMLGVKKCDKVAYSPAITVFITVYIIVTGFVYCCGIPLGFTPPFTWDTPGHSITSFIQVFHHMIIPPLMIILLFTRRGTDKFELKQLPLIGIYPFVYSIFSIIRGYFSNPHFYAYPFYSPDFIIKDSVLGGYLLMIPLLVAGIGLFIGIGALVRLVYNKRSQEGND